MSNENHAASLFQIESHGQWYCLYWGTGHSDQILYGEVSSVL